MDGGVILKLCNWNIFTSHGILRELMTMNNHQLNGNFIMILFFHLKVVEYFRIFYFHIPVYSFQIVDFKHPRRKYLWAIYWSVSVSWLKTQKKTNLIMCRVMRPRGGCLILYLIAFFSNDKQTGCQPSLYSDQNDNWKTKKNQI